MCSLNDLGSSTQFAAIRQCVVLRKAYTAVVHRTSTASVGPCMKMCPSLGQ
uniref:Uncharacterized protein n=1 Tax=Eimeria acervulina TaxID=5801 RepID=H6VQ92_EIMAC|nr:hypothetical protein [Eimeria acervulina]